MQNTPFEYDLFLSYNSQDKAAVQYLAARLEDEFDLKVFLDSSNLVPGDPWQEELEQALKKSRAVAVFIGPAGISPWHHEEMRVALDARAQDPRRRVIPVLLPGAPPSVKSEMPAFLSRLSWVEFRSLEDDDALKRLAAGARGKAPGWDGEAGPQPPPAPEPSPAEASAAGPVFHGDFAGTYVGRDQTNIQNYADRSVHVHGPLSSSTIITGDGNQIQSGPAPTPEEFRQLLGQMQAVLAQAVSRRAAS